MELRGSAGLSLAACLLVSLLAAAPTVPPEDPRRLLDGQPLGQAPFEEGEMLRYEIQWKPLFLTPAFKAGELAFTVRQSIYRNRPIYLLSAQASSEGPLSSIAGLEIRDYFESSIDRATLRSYRFLRKVRQNQRKRDLEILFDYETDTFHASEVNLEGERPHKTRDETVRGLPGPVSDLLSVFYAARMRRLEPGDHYLIHLGDHTRIRPVQIRVEQREKVRTHLASFDTVRITTVGGLFREGGDFRIWYSTGEDHLPVRFEADVKFGKVYGDVIEYSTPRLSQSLIEID